MRSTKSVDLPLKFPRAFERHDLPWPQHHCIPSSRIPALSLRLLVHTKLTEPTDKDILAGCKGSFDDFKKGFDNFRRLVFCESDLVHNRLNDVGFGN